MDLTKIHPLQQKRTIAFINHFVTTNVQFLNNFMKNCETKLMNFERKLEKLNAMMVLLEARLSSIPEVNIPSEVEKKDITVQNISENNQNTQESNTTDIPTQNEDITDSNNHPEYERFIKMVQVGVPLQAVKLKVSLEGLDPNMMDKLLK